MNSFNQKDPDERKSYTFTITNLSEIITNVVFSVEIEFPENVVDLRPLVADGGYVLQSPYVILQHFKDGMTGVTYKVRLTITTDQGNTYIASVLVPVKRK